MLKYNVVGIIKNIKGKVSWYYHRLFVANKIATLIVLACILLVGGYFGYKSYKESTTVIDPSKVVKTIPFDPILPKDTTAKDLGGWRRISPAGTEPVYAVLDSINNIPISVSQQPLPNSFEDDPSGELAKLAKKFNASNKLTVDGNTVYLGTSSNGPQSVIFVDSELLILIKSDAKISDADWSQYIKTLH